MAVGPRNKMVFGAGLKKKSSGPVRKKINLALQGGGAHGAFTWGVLDALLKDERLLVEGISGTSAGAMNGAIIAGALAQPGVDQRQFARDGLQQFWRDVSIDGKLSAGQRALTDIVLAPWRLGMAAAAPFMDATRRMASPYEFNPLDINPLRSVVESHVDCAAIQSTQGPKFFVAATNVYTGRLRVFRNKEINADVLMASAALPYLFRAVEIDGEPYWDGGFMGNPALYPFFTETESADILLVQINPVERRELPNSSLEIMERINEITFNAPLLSELRAVEFVARLIDEGRLKGTHYKSIRMHRIEAPQALSHYGATSKLKADWRFFEDLAAQGRAAGETFLAAHFDSIGVKGTLDLRGALMPSTQDQPKPAQWVGDPTR
jgi:NTE family protein